LIGVVGQGWGAVKEIPPSTANEWNDDVQLYARECNPMENMQYRTDKRPKIGRQNTTNSKIDN